jgi:PKD repeat protein
MNTFSGFLQALSVLALSLLASVSGTRAASVPTVSFSASTVNPAAGSLVQFIDTSTGSPSSWAWDFGDGGTSAERNATHVYAAAGSFTVRLTATNGSGNASATMAITVTPETVLRLNAAHTFDLTLSAVNQRTGASGVGKVIGQNDVYGYFSLPSLSGNAGNPELIVKMVDATGIGQNYWVFYGTMTDLQFTLTVTENATGIAKTYVQSTANPSGQFDTSGFQPTPTPAGGTGPTATPTPTPTPTSTAHVVNVGGTNNMFVDSVSGTNVTTIHVGDTVKWVWVGNQHSTTSGTCISGGIYGGCTSDGNWNSDFQIPPATYSRVFPNSGQFKYYCMVHLADMTGTVIVNP